MFDPEKPPELAVVHWLNTTEPVSLAALRGRVVVVLAFQMLCPTCVEHALPQARRLAQRFNPEQVAVFGLHTVFEHHDAMTPAALAAFVKQYRIEFPVGIDEAQGDGPPKSMAAYQMQGTPTLLIFDREGRLRRHYFGRPDDIMLGAEIMALAIENKGAPKAEAAQIERKIAAVLMPEGHGRDDGEHAHDHHGHAHGEACGCDHHSGHPHGHVHAEARHHDRVGAVDANRLPDGTDRG